MCQNIKKSEEIKDDSFKHNLKLLNDSIRRGEKKLSKLKQYGTLQ